MMIFNRQPCIFFMKHRLMTLIDEFPTGLISKFYITDMNKHVPVSVNTKLVAVKLPNGFLCAACWCVLFPSFFGNCPALLRGLVSTLPFVIYI